MLRKLATLKENQSIQSSQTDSLKVPAADRSGSASSRRQGSMASLSPGNQRSSLGLNGQGPSLVGLLASRRFAKRLTNRFFSRGNSTYASSRYSNATILQKEPSYRMEPHNKFNPDKVQKIIKEVLEDRLDGYKYHPKFCATMCKVLSEELKEKVKKLKFDRYKIIAVVYLGEKKDQSILVSSRGAWDSNLDGFATYNFETATVFCTASVYGVYNE